MPSGQSQHSQTPSCAVDCINPQPLLLPDTAYTRLLVLHHVLDMGKPFHEHLGDGEIYSCGVCRVPLARKEALLSKAFHAKTGKAYLFHQAANVCTGSQEERMMTTGMHIVSDLFCVSCCSCVGWRYDFAFEKTQKYKEGKVILERTLLVRTYAGDDSSCEMYYDTDEEDC